MSSMSKQQEMDALRKFAAKFDHNDYLSSLFSSDLLNWVEAQIRQDIGPDVFGWLQKYQQDANEVAGKLASANISIENAERRLRNEVQAHLQTQGSLESASEMLQEQDRTIRKMQADSVPNWQMDQQREITGKLAKKFDDACKDNIKLQRTIADLEKETLRLKAKMFDLIEERNAAEALTHTEE